MFPIGRPAYRRGERRRTRLIGCAVVVAMLSAACTTGTGADPSTGPGSTGTTSTTATDGTDGTAGPTATTGETTGTTTPTPTTWWSAPGSTVPFRTPDPDSATGVRLGLISSAGSDAFDRAVTDSVIEQADLAGAELTVCDAGADPGLVLDCARRLATQQVDGWIVLRPPGDLRDVLCDAGPQEVPLVVIGSDPLPCQSTAVGADDVRAGRLLGVALGLRARVAAGCRPAAWVLLADPASPGSTAARIAGVLDGWQAQCPGVGITPTVLDAGTQDVAYEAFATVLTGVPADADVIVAAVNDGAALGAVAAIPEGGDDHVVIGAIGADQRAWCAITTDPDWIGDAALFPERYGEVVVPTVLDLLHGESVPERILVDTALLSAGSLRKVYDVQECAGP
ncbi:substrate-binding domain-containing protein [Nakamurella sp. YIM 132087]|uniref:Substrate-binding domain-containing protein n=1 Tax=Nakamurella alba TaxID=2665158 RepID=A0A7K1FLL3_9ACTN|nr:substrate-binding domain-containing protein [Nakamurella alba]MTD14113.1 substrate-binding domain-containing protein [Nakamurella alba]